MKVGHFLVKKLELILPDEGEPYVVASLESSNAGATTLRCGPDAAPAIGSFVDVSWE